MPSPQKENGYTAIANEILDEIAKIQLNGTQARIILVIWRFTYGFQRKEHELSESFISRATDIHKKQIQRELNELIESKLILVTKQATFNTSRVLKFNKNYSEWQLKRGEGTKKLPRNEKDTHTGSELAPSTGSEKDPQERKIKENIKEIYAHFDLMWKMYPRKMGKGSVSDSKKKELLNVSLEEMERAINRYKIEIKKNNIDEKYIKYGSTFFNSGYVDYLDANYEGHSKDEESKPISTEFKPKFIVKEFGQ